MSSRHFVSLVSFLLSLSLITSSQNMKSQFTGVNIGNPHLSGSTNYNADKQVYLLKGAGENMWFGKDECWFEHKPMKGDFILSANLEFIGEGTNAHRKIGLMLREGLESSSAQINVTTHGDGLTCMQYREADAENTKEIRTEALAPVFLQIERKGDKIIARMAKKDEPLITIGEKQLSLPDTVFIGLFICSHERNSIETARFWNVRIEVPAADGINGYENPSPSRLEMVEVETGLRKIIYETSDHIEAPNWTRCGTYLIYNSEGKLYKFNLKTRKVKEINTGFATSNNNDHGISFDGKYLALSHHLEENGINKSIIYTVPVEGGVPTRITQNGPSYWHGWSPDGKWLTYCAERNGNYDVYKIPSSGGVEIRLTEAEGLDDGPEYSPDGKFIYFNSVRSGMMQIWKMKPDGSEQEQVTADNFQNWFAHPSPNGKWLIMISYLPDVAASAHPHNKRVMLRLLEIKTGTIKTIAFLYGGQGTINVPSWSPDSKKVAFVS